MSYDPDTENTWGLARVGHYGNHSWTNSLGSSIVHYDIGSNYWGEDGHGTPRIGMETRPTNIALLPCIKY